MNLHTQMEQDCYFYFPGEEESDSCLAFIQYLPAEKHGNLLPGLLRYCAENTRLHVDYVGRA